MTAVLVENKYYPNIQKCKPGLSRTTDQLILDKLLKQIFKHYIFKTEKSKKKMPSSQGTNMGFSVRSHDSLPLFIFIQ